MKHCLFLLLVFLSQNKSFAQTVEKPEWVIPPIIDTLTEEMKHQRSFIFKAKNKYGYFAENHLTIPAMYDSIWMLKGFPDLIFVKLRNLIGMYKMYETLPTIPCQYDQINYIKRKAAFELRKGTQISWYQIKTSGDNPDMEIVDGAVDNTPPPREEHFGLTESNNKAASNEFLDSLKKQGYEHSYNFTPDLNVYCSRKLNKFYKVYSKSQKAFLNDVPFDAIKTEGKFLVCCYRKNFSKTIVYNQQGKSVLEYAYEKTIYLDSLNNNIQKMYRCFQLDDKNSQSLYIYDLNYVRLLEQPFAKVVFNNHPAMASCYDLSGEEHLYNLITGKILPFKTSQVTYFHPSYNSVFVHDSKSYFWNLQNDTYKEVPFSKIEYWYLYPNNGAIVRSTNGYALFNLDSLKFMTPSYDTICPIPLAKFYDSPYATLLQYKVNGKYGLINTRGRIYTEPIYRKSEAQLLFMYPGYFLHHDHGINLLYRKVKLDSISAYYSSDEHSNYFFYKKDRKWGLLHLPSENTINATGDTFYLVPYSHDYLIVFKQGKKLQVVDAYFNNTEPTIVEADSIIQINDEEHPVWVVTKRQGKYGVATHQQQVLPNRYDEVKSLGKRILGLKDSKQSIIFIYYDERFTRLIDVSYSNWFTGLNGFLWLKQNGKWGLITY